MKKDAKLTDGIKRVLGKIAQSKSHEARNWRELEEKSTKVSWSLMINV